MIIIYVVAGWVLFGYVTIGIHMAIDRTMTRIGVHDIAPIFYIICMGPFGLFISLWNLQVFIREKKLRKLRKALEEYEARKNTEKEEK